MQNTALSTVQAAFLPQLFREVFGTGMVVTLEHAQVLVTGHGGQLQNVAQLFRQARCSFVAGVMEMDILQKATNRAFTGCSAVFLLLLLGTFQGALESFAQSHGRRLKHRPFMGVVCTSQDLQLPQNGHRLAREGHHA